jgi:hypothetical protein
MRNDERSNIPAGQPRGRTMMIELTEAGFRRMGQAHTAVLDTIIEDDLRYLLRFPASPAR